MDFETKKYLLDTAIKVIEKSNGNGIEKSFDLQNISRIYYRLAIIFNNNKKDKGNFDNRLYQ